ncbi:MAG: precorrin-6y C5,15-methyltransferase (decarboxylating) subunit CbiE [Desulfobacterales bacterium]|nr:precorrin-6y C5,15-methyltransferase (decarboxylating) subunit CbiE [Desulfobacterales bacterium]
MNPVRVVGIGLGVEDLTERHREIIRQSDILVGGGRHLGYFKDYAGEKLLITGDIQGVFEEIKDRMQNRSVVVLASGDPNFFGIGPSLVEYLGEDNVVIHPNISVAAAAFSRIKLSWHDAVVVSLHGGKSEKEVFDAIIKKDKVAVFTDSKRTPGWLACKLIEINQDNLRVCIFEDLGSSNEHFAWYSLQEAAAKEFAALNIVIIIRTGNQRRQMPVAYFGMPEDAYTHEKGLITKTEVRAVAIAKLRLFPHHVLWDLGGGSGSVSIEASLLVKDGMVICVEKRPERVEQIKKNIKQFQVTNVRAIHSHLPEGLKDLPRPDRIFIGGGGKDLLKIIKKAVSYMRSDGLMVVNTILLNNVELVRSTFTGMGLRTDVVQLQVNRGKEMPWGERLEALNPVWIITGTKV